MAHKIVKSDSSLETGVAEIIVLCDSVNDLNAVGTNFAPMSQALVKTGDGYEAYILGASGQWDKV